jgi:hypothetical protein
MCVSIDDGLSASRLGWVSPDRPARLRLVGDTYGLDGLERYELLEILAISMAPVASSSVAVLQPGIPTSSKCGTKWVA